MKDGHIHTPFCPHGTKDSLEAYVEKAIEFGFTEITFTEHAPLPKNFVDPTPLKDSGMDWNQLEQYFQDVERVKAIYKNDIKINVGLEIDFIEGFEEETKLFLNQFGNRLDDSILSVHFLKFDGTYDCLDYSPDCFANMVDRYGSVKRIYEVYFNTLIQSIDSDLGPYKPKRIGHITLVKKFQQKFPMSLTHFTDHINTILQKIKEKGYELDLNGAGTAKPLCREMYPSKWIVEQAIDLQIPLVYGSDAHQAKELTQGLNEALPFIRK